MVNEDRQRESFSRRRLDFTHVNSHVYGKAFYLDIRKPLLKEKVIKCIRHLDGIVEDFLCKEIDLLVTDRPVSVSESRGVTLRQDQSQNPSSPNCTPLPSPDTPFASQTQSSSSLFAGGSAKPLTRTQTLLLKAQQSYTQTQQQTPNSETPSNTSIIQKAISLDIKVLSADKFLAQYQQHSKRNKAEETFRFEDDPLLSSSRSARVTRSNSHLPPAGLSTEIKPCVKVEDFSRRFKPLYRTFERLPEISYELVLTSRTSHSKKRQKTTPRTISATPRESRTGHRSLQRRSIVKGTKQSQRGGYCESCDYWYTGKVREHLAGSRHQQFAKNSENYESLDIVIDKLPGLDEFISSVTKACVTPHPDPTVDVEMKDLSRGPDDNRDQNQCQSQPLNVSMADGESVKNADQIHRGADVRNCPDVIETDDTPHVTGKPKILRKLFVAKCTIVENVDTVMSEGGEVAAGQPAVSENSSVAPIIPANGAADNQDKIDDDILNIVNAVSRNVTNFDEHDDFNSFDLAPPVLERAEIIRDADIKPPVAERPPVLQQIHLNHQVRNRADWKPPRKRLDFGTVKKSVRPTDSQPSGPQPFVFGQDNPLNSPSDLLMRFVQASASCKDTTSHAVETRKRRRSRERSHENFTSHNNVYYAMKTSDMKLKLCRVSDNDKKAASSKDLKSYWKVRKSGDCKLVFSPKYKPGYRNRTRRRIGQWNQENDPPVETLEPTSKRAKVDIS